MTKVLDTVDAALQEIEEQLLEEFKRIRNTLSDSPFETIDKGVQNSLSGVVVELLHMLENSGDRTNLQLQTERHETLFSRASVIKQLLKAKIPTAYLHEVHKEVKSSRKKLEGKVVEKRAQKKASTTTATSIGLLDSLKNILTGKVSKQENLRNKIKVTEQEAKEFEAVEIYLDNGIYSASRELAMLSSRLFDAGEFKDSTITKKTETAQRKAPPSPPSGKATFESRDLSQQPPPSQKNPTTQKGSLAQTPDEIRRKLENNQSKPKTISTFEAKDVTQTISQVDNIQAVEKGKPEKIALSPEEIRKKLAARQQPSTMGKATFGSKDIKHAMPATHRPLPSNTLSPEPNAKEQTTTTSGTPEKDTQVPTGKAVFESKDLSHSGPTRKR